MKTTNMTNETPYMEPTVHGSGIGGQGFGLGQLPEQSTHEHVPLVFYIPNQKTKTQKVNGTATNNKKYIKQLR